MKIKILKAEFRCNYKKYLAKLGEYSCGGDLAEFINPDLLKLKNKCNSILDKLAEIDPACPKARLK